MEIENIKTVVAIDPGVAQGGIAIFTGGKMIVRKNGRTLDEISDLLTQIKENFTEVAFVIEKVQAFSFGGDSAPGKSFNINKMLKNYEQLITVIKMLGFPLIEVHPRTWQNYLELNKKYDIPLKRLSDKEKEARKRERKNKYKQFAQEKYPEIRVTLWNSDALCIAHFLLLKITQQPDWVEKNIQQKKINGKMF